MLPISFSGDFDGNGYSITNLFINRANESNVGLFGVCGRTKISHNKIENLVLKNFTIIGDRYVGSLAGFADNSDFSNIKIYSPKIEGTSVVGGIIGTTNKVQADNIQLTMEQESIQLRPLSIYGKNVFGNKGFLIGGAGKGKISAMLDTKENLFTLLNEYKNLGIGNEDNQTVITLTIKDESIKICAENQSSGCGKALVKLEVADGLNRQHSTVTNILENGDILWQVEPYKISSSTKNSLMNKLVNIVAVIEKASYTNACLKQPIRNHNL